MEKVIKEQIVNLLESKVLCCVDGPVHVVLDPLVQLDEVLAGDYVVGVEIQNVIEKVFELVLLEVGQQILTGKLKWNSFWTQVVAKDLLSL